VVFLETVDLLRHAAQICFMSGYERGTVECLNMMIRCCCNSNDLCIVRLVYRILVSVYNQFR
jgi:hypothetical protein